MSHRILYVSAPTPVLILTTAQPTRSVPDISTNLGAYINGTDTGYCGTRVLVIFIRGAEAGSLCAARDSPRDWSLP